MNLPAAALPTVEHLFDGKPILQKEMSHPWENRVTFNPACVLVEDRATLTRVINALPFDRETRIRLTRYRGLCFLFYRAQGARTDEYDYTRSSIGLAVFTPDLKPLARQTEPAILPDAGYDDLGVEDPRITRIGETFVMMYTAYGSGSPRNRIRIAIATSGDLVHWTKSGLLQGEFNTFDNKNGILFPERVRGKLLMFHRPMQGKDALSIHLAEADELWGEWTSLGPVMKPLPDPAFADTWIGGGAPPLPLEDGRLLITYHIGHRKEDGSREYHLGIAVGEPQRPELIVRRDEPLLRPSLPAETAGDAELGVSNVVFVCGAYFFKRDLYLPYAGADSVVLGGKISSANLRKYLQSNG
jgi:predicted GH43/DUF377 family glycosyl hydrolase